MRAGQLVSGWARQEQKNERSRGSWLARHRRLFGGGGRGGVPLSSSFFAGRLLNCLHHEVRSRLDEAGSGVAASAGAGWGSPLRTRGVWGLVCVPPGMASGPKSVAALQTGVFAGRRR